MERRLEQKGLNLMGWWRKVVARVWWSADPLVARRGVGSSPTHHTKFRYKRS